MPLQREAVHHKQRADLNLWLALGAAASVLAWLLPDHRVPWPAFFNEALAAFGLLPLAFWIGLRSASKIEIPGPALVVLAIAVVPVVQWLAGQLRFGGDAALASMYLVALAMSIVAGAQWRRLASQSVDIGLPLTALTAAMLSLCLALMQWLQIDDLGVLLASLPVGARPAGNIAQANHMSTLFVWGLLGSWLLFEQYRIRSTIATVCAALLLFGVVMSQSRTGWVQIALLACCALVFRRRFGLRITAPAVGALALAFCTAVFGWQALTRLVGQEAALTLEQRVVAGPRVAIWRQAFAAIDAAPWAGYGWTQGGLAQQAVATQSPPLNIVTNHAHDVVLDLMVWNGVPLGILLASLICAWGVHRARRLQSASEVICGLSLLVFAVHALVEFPHSYAYFLLPVGLLVGVSDARESCTTRRVAVPRWSWIAAVLAMTLLLATTTNDYLRIQNSLMQYRFDAARVGPRSDSSVPDVLVLTQLEALMTFLRTPPASGLGTETLSRMQIVVHRFPSHGNQFRMALAWARNGHADRASEQLTQLCAIQRKPSCATAAAAWATISEDDEALRLVRFR